jgi:hypothetical protein
MQYLIEMLSTRTGQKLGYVMRIRGGNPSYPMTFDSKAKADAECARMTGYLRHSWREYQVVEKKEKVA